MPTLTRYHVNISDDLGPEAVRHLAVSARGAIAFPPSYRSEDFLVRWVDSSGALVGVAGRYGQGPGEIQGFDYLAFERNRLLVVDYHQARVVRFNAAGRPGQMARIKFGARALHFEDDSVDIYVSEGPQAASIMRAPEGTESGGRVLITTSDTAFRRILALRGEYLREGPPYTAAEDRFVIADPLSYTLYSYSLDGQLIGTMSRNMPPRHYTERELEIQRDELEGRVRGGFRGPDGRRIRLSGAEHRLDTLAREQLPHFGRRGLQFDAERRLWVIGEANDSTFVDVFADTVFLGRRMLPCSGFRRAVSLSTRWLGLLCQAPSDAEFPEIQLYRIGEEWQN